MMVNIRMRYTFFLSSFLALLSLSGCGTVFDPSQHPDSWSVAGAFDPFQRPGNWAATGANNENIAEQAANKSDLISGQSEPGSNGIAAVGGIEKAVTGGTAAGLQTPVQATSSSATISTGS
jgi:hypothetical protein